MGSVASAVASLFKGIGTTYSFKDLAGALTSPLAGAFTFAGEIGSGKITVENTTEHGVNDTAADGTVVPGYVAGEAGRITIECQQTSTLHKFLLFWFNLHNTNAKAGDVSQWAGTAILMRNTLDGTSHQALGVTPTKIPDKAYDTNPGKVTWVLLAANLTSL